MKHDEQVRHVAYSQRLLLWAVLASILGVVVPVLAFITIPFQLFCVIRLVWALGIGIFGQIVYALAMFVPCVSLLFLLHLNGKATRFLREAGIKVGFMGAGKADLPSENQEHDRKPPLAVPIIAGCVSFVFLAGVVLAVAVPYFISYKRTTCDRAAHADMQKLGAALERFANERKDMNCNIDQIPAEVLEYIIGPYYGWGGTNVKCDVRVRVEGNEAWGCSSKGSHPEGPDNRYLFGVRLSTGERLPAKIGKCSGKPYGGNGSEAYLSSAIGSGCQVRRPVESTPYRKFGPDYE